MTLQGSNRKERLPPSQAAKCPVKELRAHPAACWPIKRKDLYKC